LIIRKVKGRSVYTFSLPVGIVRRLPDKTIKWSDNKKNKELTFCDVQVEEVEIENSLDAACDHDDLIKIVFRMVTVHPVAEVKEPKKCQIKGKKNWKLPVDSKKEEIVARDDFGLASISDHLQLGDDGDGL